MGKIIQSPAPLEPSAKNAVFLAGGISGCADWQTAVAERLAANTNATIYNPRRVGDFANTGTEARIQIKWEHAALRLSQVNLFWFPPDTLCPITLFELGSALERMRPGALLVGAHPDYKRLFDLEVQTELMGRIPVYEDLEALVNDAEILLRNIDHLISIHNPD